MPPDRLTQGLLRHDLQSVAALINRGERVLDLGCGDGDLLAYLIGAMDCTGTGVERDPGAVMAAIGRGVPLIELDLDTQLGEFGDDSFDVVVLSRTLQAVLRPKGSERDGGGPRNGDGVRRGSPDYFGRGGEVRERDEAGGGENGMNRKQAPVRRLFFPQGPRAVRQRS